MKTADPLYPLIQFFCTACLALTLPFSPVVTKADSQSEVALWFESGLAVATSQLSGRREIPLGAQEVVISSGSSGINGMVVTSRRLLGFSSRALTWSKQELDVNENVLERKILPT